MAKTIRNIPGKLRSLQDPELIGRIKRGLVAIPKPWPLKGGGQGVDEVWGQATKRLAKRLHTRGVRRRKIEETDE